MKTYRITYNKKYSKRGSGHKASQVAHAIAGLCNKAPYGEADKVIIVEANNGKFIDSFNDCRSPKFMQVDYAEVHGEGEPEYTAWATVTMTL